MSARTSVRRFLSLALSIAAVAWMGAGPAPQPGNQTDLVLSAAEFPEYDAEVWRQQRSGLANKWIDARLTETPATPALAELLEQNRVDEGLRLLGSIVDQYPQDIPRAFEIVGQKSSKFDDVARGYPAALQELVDAARKQLARLPREEAARADRALLQIDRRRPVDEAPSWGVDRLRAFVTQYAGTETALLTEIDVMQFALPIRERLDALDRFVRDHPGTRAAAKALHNKGFQLASGNVYPELEARGADPTERFFRVLDIVNELESGRYPACEWVDRAPSLVTHFFAHNPTYATGSIDRLLAAYQAFVKTHFVVSDQYPLNSDPGYIITTKMFDLFKAKGEGIASVERVFTELESEIADVAALRFLRAQFYVRSINWEPTERAAFYRKAVDSLTRLEAQGSGLYHRKALATLASLYFAQGEHARARHAFSKYLRAYPETEWAWVAAVRIGQCSEALGDWKAAVDAHLAAASKYASIPLANVLGHAYAARSYEALGRFDRALREYQAARAGWDTDYGPVYSLSGLYNPRPDERVAIQLRAGDAGSTLPEKVAQLESSARIHGGALLERGRWFIERKEYRQALIPLEQLLTQHQQSPAISEGRYLTHRARLGRALDLAAAANPRRNDAAAIALLDRVTRDPYDFGVCAAKVAKATILFRSGREADADALMRSALMEWYDHQKPRREAPRNTLQTDIADIRIVVMGRSADPRAGGWLRNMNSQGRQAVPFAIVNPDISVKLPQNQRMHQTVYQPLPGADWILFLTKEHQAILNDIVESLGSKATDTQNVGADVLEQWNRFFKTANSFGDQRIVVETFPVIAELEFLDAGRTRAAARIVAGHQGGTIVLEKNQGVWIAKELVNMWIS